MIIRFELLGSDLRRIVLRLGVFHAEMSFKWLLQVVASSGCFKWRYMHPTQWCLYMLSGKAITRAVRAPFIVDAALNAMMLTDVLDAPLPIQPDKSNSNDNAEEATMPPCMPDELIDTPDLEEARVLYEKLVDGTVYVEDILVQQIREKSCILW